MREGSEAQVLAHDCHTLSSSQSFIGANHRQRVERGRSLPNAPVNTSAEVNRYQEVVSACRNLGRRLPAYPIGSGCPLPAKPVLQLPRRHVSWGHSVQQTLRAFVARLVKCDVLAALGASQAPTSFVGSATDDNWLVRLAYTVRHHRLSAYKSICKLLKANVQIRAFV